jgi:predicted amidohydrolase YtcJ
MNPNLTISNAKIFTANPAQPWAEALACAGGKIIAVGSSAEIRAMAGPATRQINAGGRLVLPGLIDAHVHFLQVAQRRHQVSLFGVRNFAEVRRRVQEAVASAQPGLWVQGWGWDENLWDIAPTATLLDELAPNVPVVLARLDMHTWWVNSAVLKLAGITRDTADPPESKIERDASGRPTGLLREWNAIELVQKHIPRPSPVVLRQWLLEAIDYAHSLGLTGIHDQRVEREGRQSLRLWQSLRQADELKLRVHMNIAADFLPEVATLGLQPGFGDDRLWLGHAKAFADGTMGSQTALMLTPFEGSTDNIGLAVTPATELTDLAEQARRAGFSLSVHAIGDRAVREVAHVMSEFPPDAAAGHLPHRIEHVQIINPNDLTTLAQHGIFASMQPVHLHADWRTADKVWGSRARYTYAFHSLLEQGTPLAFGSDAPVAPLDPLLGIHAALTRQDPDGLPAAGWYPQERIDLKTVLHAYTTGPATLAGKTAQQGALAPGKWADLIVLRDNLFEIEPAAVKDSCVDLTVFNGDVVFER